MRLAVLLAAAATAAGDSSGIHHMDLIEVIPQFTDVQLLHFGSPVAEGPDGMLYSGNVIFNTETNEAGKLASGANAVATVANADSVIAVPQGKGDWTVWEPGAPLGSCGHCCRHREPRP